MTLQSGRYNDVAYQIFVMPIRNSELLQFYKVHYSFQGPDGWRFESAVEVDGEIAMFQHVIEATQFGHSSVISHIREVYQHADGDSLSGKVVNIQSRR